MADDGGSRRALRVGACVFAPLLLLSVAFYARLPYDEVVDEPARIFGRHGAAVDAALKGPAGAWVPYDAREHPTKPTSLWGKVRRPYPTGAWWTNLVVGGPVSSGEGLGAAMMTPYGVAVVPDRGVVLSYGAVAATNESITVSATADLTVSMAEGVDSRHVESFDDLSMIMRVTGAKHGTMDALFARGSPYATFSYARARPLLGSDAEVKDVSTVPPTNASGVRRCDAFPGCVAASLEGDCCPQPSGVTHPCCDGSLGKQGPAEVFKVELSNGQEWRVYTSAPITLEWDSKRVTSSAPYDGILRVAYVPPDPDPEDASVTPNAVMLDAHAESYATAGDVRVTADRSADPDVAVVEFTWRVAYMGSDLSLLEPRPALLMLALPHHVDVLVADDTVGFLAPSSLAYRGGLKGTCTPVLGTSWRMREPLTTIGWRPPRSVLDADRVATLKAQLVEDVERPDGETDADADWIAFNDWFGNAYWNGKEVARLAQLALVADDVGDATSKASALAQMRAILDLWLEGKNGDPLVYDATYGGLCTTKGLYDHDADFGNGYYNDHHFHYGYLLYGAAVAVKNDAGFAATYREALFALLYDVANPGLGTSFFEVGIDRGAFPKARHKDFYDGHSWASGIFFMGQGKAQESSSEAVNAYYGAYLLATALGDVELADWTRALLALEVRAAKKYYHMPKGNAIYPKHFSRHKMVGVLGALSTGSATWFGPNVAFAHGIQILPVTPITEDLLEPADFITEDLDFLTKNLEPDVEDSWKGFLIAEKAVVDPDAAWADVAALDTVDAGASKTALYSWIATRPDTADRSAT